MGQTDIKGENRHVDQKDTGVENKNNPKGRQTNSPTDKQAGKDEA